MRKLIPILAAALIFPAAALAQAGPGPGPGPGMGMGRGMGPPGEMGPGARDPKRAKLALTLGLAEALELDDAQALKMREVVDRFVAKRVPLHQQQHDAMQVLRAAASSEKPDGAAVDQAVARLHDARAQIAALDKEFVGAVVKDLPPQKKARAVLFLGRFHQRMMMREGGPEGRHGPRLRGPGGPGMPGLGEAGPGPAGDAMVLVDEPPELDEL